MPIENQFYVHPAKQQDGRMTVQIVGRFEIYNLSDQPIVLIDVKPIKPRITGKLINRLINVQDTNSQYSGRYPVPPYTMGNGSFMLIAYQDFSSRGSEVDVVVKVSDQFGRSHKIAVKHARKN